MSSNTTNLSLLKMDPTTDGASTFNIKTMMNDNWDKVDAVTGPASAASKGVVHIGSGIDVDGAGVISVPTVTVPVSSVNSKTGAVVLVPSDIGAATAAQGAEADSTATTVTAHLADDVHHVNYAADTGVANAYVVTLSPDPTSYVAGMVISFKATNANTGASTINVNALGVKSITKNVSAALVAGDILAGQIVDLEYDGTNFQFVPTNILPATVAPVMDGTATVGTSVLYARQDHAHASDTSKQSALGFTPVNKAGDTMTGGLTAPTLTSSGTVSAATSASSSANNVRKSTTSTGTPSGGADGDIWFQYS